MPKINFLSFQILLTSSSKLVAVKTALFAASHTQTLGPTLPTIIQCLVSPLIVSSPPPGPQAPISPCWALGLPAALPPPAPAPHGLVGLPWKSSLEPLQRLPFYSPCLHPHNHFFWLPSSITTTLVCSKPPFKVYNFSFGKHFKPTDNFGGTINIGKHLRTTHLAPGTVLAPVWTHLTLPTMPQGRHLC